MKSILKKVLKTLLVFVVSTIVIYLVFTITSFYTWCTENQISMFINFDELLLHLDSKKIQTIGDTVGSYAQLLEESLNESYYENDRDYHSLAEYYDPLGFSVWSYMQTGISEVLSRYFNISILLGISIAIAYAIIASKKINNILKIILGYFGIMLIGPQILFLSYFYRLFGIFTAYYATPHIKYFYIGYTTIFVLMYIINYKIGVKMTKQLNQAIQNNIK